jgi:hypothetical protein
VDEVETGSLVEGPCRVATAEEDSGGRLYAGVGPPWCWYFGGVEKARLDTAVEGANVGGRAPLLGSPRGSGALDP